VSLSGRHLAPLIAIAAIGQHRGVLLHERLGGPLPLRGPGPVDQRLVVVAVVLQPVGEGVVVDRLVAVLLDGREERRPFLLRGRHYLFSLPEGGSAMNAGWVQTCRSDVMVLGYMNSQNRPPSGTGPVRNGSTMPTGAASLLARPATRPTCWPGDRASAASTG